MVCDGSRLHIPQIKDVEINGIVRSLAILSIIITYFGTERYWMSLISP